VYLSLSRLSVINEHVPLNYLHAGGKMVVAFWHQRFFGALGYAGRFSEYSPSVMISRSADGEMIAKVVVQLGLRPIRGSSSQGGRWALRAIIDDFVHNQIVAHAVDGPQGPRCVVKSGLIKIAQLSGAAIFPLYISMNRAWRLNSWDRFLIPKPFCRIVLEWGDPIFIPRDTSPDAFEHFRLHAEHIMKEGYTKADQRMGWKHHL
jgi:hypothetical protein